MSETINDETSCLGSANDAGAQVVPQQQQQQQLSRSKSLHAVIKPPKYVRTQTLGLERARTVSFNTQTRDSAVSTARDSVAFPAGTSVSAQPKPDPSTLHRPLKRRSDSLPSFAGPPPKSEPVVYEYGSLCDVGELPADPKTWMPSQLSIYLAHVLRLTPKPLINDVQRFVVKSGLTGKRFLRLSDPDLVELGINLSWCLILSKARDRLRAETLRAKIFIANHTADSAEGEDFPEPGNESMSFFLTLPRSQAEQEDWKKNSWRRKEGKHSRGRVKGIAHLFEEGKNRGEGEARSRAGSLSQELEEVERIRKSRSRQNSSDSSCTSDGGSDIVEADPVNLRSDGQTGEVPDGTSTYNWGLVEPITFEEAQDASIGLEPKLEDTSSSSLSVRSDDWQSNIRSHGNDAYSPVRLSEETLSSVFDDEFRRPATNTKTGLSASTSLPSIYTALAEPDEEGMHDKDVNSEDKALAFAENSGNIETVKKATLRGRSSSIQDFGSVRISSVRSQTKSGQALQDLFNDQAPIEQNLLEVKSRDGSMVNIPKEQYDALHARLADMEAKLAEEKARSASSRAIDSIPDRNRQMSDWVRSALGETGSVSVSDPTWAGLGGWALAAGLGIGVVVGEAVIRKLRR